MTRRTIRNGTVVNKHIFFAHHFNGIQLAMKLRDLGGVGCGVESVKAEDCLGWFLRPEMLGMGRGFFRGHV